MKTMFVRSLFFLVGGVAILCVVVTPVFAQTNADVAALQRIIEEQQRQLDAQQKQLDAQRELLQQIVGGLIGRMI